MDSLAEQVRQSVRHSNGDEAEPKVLVIDFFRNTLGSSSELGTLLANRLSESLSASSTGLKILDRRVLKDYLIQEWTTLEDLSTADGCRLIGQQLGATGVLVGILDEDNGHIRLTLHREGFGPLPLNEDLLQGPDESIRFPSTELLHSLLYERGPNYARIANEVPEEPGVFLAGANGVTNPECIYCPQPDYSDAARAMKYSGTVLLSIIVTVEGQATAPYVLKGAALGLTGKSLKQIKNWKFKPAQKDGKPVAARVSIATTFHTY